MIVGITIVAGSYYAFSYFYLKIYKINWLIGALWVIYITIWIFFDCGGQFN